MGALPKNAAPGYILGTGAGALTGVGMAFQLQR